VTAVSSATDANDALYSIGLLSQALEGLCEIESAPDGTAVAVAKLLGAYETLWSSYPAGAATFRGAGSWQGE
jgi:hypothetical protein